MPGLCPHGEGCKQCVPLGEYQGHALFLHNGEIPILAAIGDRYAVTMVFDWLAIRQYPPTDPLAIAFNRAKAAGFAEVPT